MTPLNRAQLLTEDDYLAKVEEYGDEFHACMGAEGVRELLRTLNIEVEVEKLRKDLSETVPTPRSRSLPSASRCWRHSRNRHQAGVDDSGSAAGAAAGTASAGAAGWWPLRDL